MPLTTVTKKNLPNKVNWIQPYKRAFKHLKDMLADYPILTTPEWKMPFVLQTDAFATGIVYMLSQMNRDGKKIPYSFWFKEL